MSDELPSSRHHHHAPVVARRIRLVAAVIRRGDELLLAPTSSKVVRGAAWELPGGRIADGETPEHAIARALRTTFGVIAEPTAITATETEDRFAGPEIEVVYLSCRLDAFDLSNPGGHGLRWIDRRHVSTFDMAKHQRDFVRKLAAVA